MSRNFINRLNAKRKIFIDCGANTGKILEEFIPKKKGFEFFAFEPQPELADTGNRVKAKFPLTPLTFYNKAVWTENTELEFFLATRWGPNFKGGSTLLGGHTLNQCEIDYKHPVKVHAIDFSGWIKNSFNPKDYLIIKMDIEGAEYEVLEKMIADQTILYVNELIVEFHHQMNNAISEERHSALVKQLKKQVLLTLWY